jgi:hypothetical protein
MLDPGPVGRSSLGVTEPASESLELAGLPTVKTCHTEDRDHHKPTDNQQSQPVGRHQNPRLRWISSTCASAIACFTSFNSFT